MVPDHKSRLKSPKTYGEGTSVSYISLYSHDICKVAPEK